MWEICGYNMLLPVGAGVVLLFSCWFLASKRVGLLVGNHIVDASSLVIFFALSWCERLSKSPFTEEGVWCKLSAY